MPELTNRPDPTSRWGTYARHLPRLSITALALVFAIDWFNAFLRASHDYRDRVLIVAVVSTARHTALVMGIIIHLLGVRAWPWRSLWLLWAFAYGWVVFLQIARLLNR